MKKIPLRTCVITHEAHPKKELMRIVATKEGECFVDPTGRANGRGAYVLLRGDVIEKARKSNALSAKLGVKVPDSVFETLEALWKEQQENGK